MDTTSILSVELWDKDVIWDDLLGSCSWPLSQGRHYLTCPAQEGIGGFEIMYTLNCDPNLAGYKCKDYNPSPR